MHIITNTSVYTDKGRIREYNEDNFFVNGKILPPAGLKETIFFQEQSNAACQLLAVCDGMGGEAKGEIASAAAVDALTLFAKCLEECFDSTAALQEQVHELNRSVLNSLATVEGKGGGTTLTALLFCNGKYRTLNIGDSRVYRLHDGSLCQLTKDDSEVQRMVDMGVLTPDQAASHPRKNVITRYLGIPAEYGEIDAAISEPELLRAGDRFLLCSDGVCGVIGPEKLSEQLNKDPTKGSLAEKVALQALEDKTRDNLTAIVVEITSCDETVQKEEHWTVPQAETPGEKRVLLTMILTIVVMLAMLLLVLQLFSHRQITEEICESPSVASTIIPMPSVTIPETVSPYKKPLFPQKTAKPTNVPIIDSESDQFPL